LPDGWKFGDVAGVGIDSHDRVYAFNRGPHPMIVFDRDGAFRESWGEGVFTRAHGVHVTADDLLYLTDDGDHTVRRCTLDGEVQLLLGTPGVPALRYSCRPFNRCTHTALSPSGDIWVSDGYENAAIHRYSPTGELLYTMGEPGVGPGQFNLPHGLFCDDDGTLYVADRQNHRVQLFDDEGAFLDMWHNVHRPSSILRLSKPGAERLWLVAELGPVDSFNRGAPNFGPRLSILDAAGQVLLRLGVTPAAGLEPGQFLSPHGIAIDSHGDIYVAQVSATIFPTLFPGEPVPDHLPSLQKLVRIR
jgi:DNA-binding beta-propeller fold protein YncE